MSNNQLISVIIPVYNIEKYIARCLESVRMQIYKNLEIIVVDDGSTDKTGKIIDDIATMDDRIIVIHKQNSGVSAARNTGLERSTGDYIGFVDGDDIIDSDMYEFLINNALKYDADISHCGYKMVFPDRVDYYYNTGEVRIQDNYQGIFDLISADKVEPGLCNKLYKRALFHNNRLDEHIKINEDLLLNYYLFKEAKKSVYEDVAKYHYMIRKNSAATSNININKIKDPLVVIQTIMSQETGEVRKLLEKRYLYLLEKVSALRITGSNKELQEYQRLKITELKEKLRDTKLGDEYSKKEKFQLKLAVISPMLYRFVHEIYAHITGSKDRYKV